MSASRNSKKEVSSHNTEVLQDMTRRAKEFYDSLNRETNRVCKQVEARDGPGKKLEQNPFPKILKLNVGGHIFLTSLATLHNASSSNFTEIVTFVFRSPQQKNIITGKYISHNCTKNK